MYPSIRTLICLAVVLCAAGHAAAQTSVNQAPPPAAPSAGRDADAATVEALAAILRGDFPRAAELLKPLVEDWSADVGPAAAFFLATLYENGLGVPHDPTRACALYARSEAGEGPLALLGRQLAQARMSELGAELSAECVLLANVGINHGFAPARFMLDADHWVAIDLDTKNHNVVATVSYQGKQKSRPLATQVSTGTTFLPIEYTLLETGKPSAARRHFVEVVAWLPQSASNWVLAWSLTEITNGEATYVASQILTILEGGPPNDLLVELRDLVVLRVNESGFAEFEILGGPEPRREAIPDRTEREQEAAEAKKRSAAKEKIDWKRRRDPNRAPSLSYSDAEGCGDLLVHGWAIDRGETIAIRADRTLLNLENSPRTFDLAAAQGEIEVFANVFDRPQQSGLCDNPLVREEGYRQETWRAVAGTMRIEVSAPGVRAQHPRQYRATIQIEGAEFSGPTGQRVRAAKAISLTAVAGPSGESGP
jgi:hypothetical protein